MIMKRLILLLLVVPCCLMAQEKIGNKIYKYGDVYHAIEGNTLISFEEADAKTMSKTLEYFSDTGAPVKSWNSLFLPGSNVAEDEFDTTLNSNNIETLILIDVIDASIATMNRTTASAYATSSAYASANRNQVRRESEASSGSVTTSQVVNYTTEMSLRLTIFSKKDGFAKPVAVVEGNVFNLGQEYTSDDQLVRRIIRRMVKGLEKQNAF
jgi:hypothetical protein